MKVQHLTVIGDPLICCVDGCYEAAVVLLRQDSEDDDRQMIFCETCWLATTHAYSPLVQRDVVRATHEAEVIVRHPHG